MLWNHLIDCVLGPDYGTGIVGKCLAHDVEWSGSTKDGCKIFWTYVSQPVTNALCIVTLQARNCLIFALKHQFHAMAWQCCIWSDSNAQRKKLTHALYSIRTTLKDGTREVRFFWQISIITLVRLRLTEIGTIILCFQGSATFHILRVGRAPERPKNYCDPRTYAQTVWSTSTKVCTVTHAGE